MHSACTAPGRLVALLLLAIGLALECPRSLAQQTEPPPPEGRAERGSTAVGMEDPGAPEEESPAIDEIVVVASRFPTLSFDEPYQARSVPAFSGASPGQPRTIARALGDLPQIMVQKTSYGQASPYLRGFTGFRTLILLDGIRINNSVFRDGPNQYASLIDPLALDRAEVTFGPSSVLYGSDAVGGALSFVTSSPGYSTDGRRWGGRLYQRFASAEDSSVTRLEGSASSGRFAFLAGASYKDFDDVSGGRHQGTLDNTGYREWGGNAKGLVRLGDELDLTIAYQRAFQEDVPRTHSTIFSQSYRGTTIGSDLRRDLDQFLELSYVRLEWSPDESRRAELTGYRYVLEEDENRVRSNNRKRLQGFDVITHGVTFNYRDDTRWGRITAGVEYIREGVDSYFREFNDDGSLRELRTRGPVADQATYQTAAAYLEDRFDVTERVEVSLGGRYTYVDVDADDVDPDPTDANVIPSVDEDYSDFVGSARAVFRASESFNIFGGVSQAFRAPNLSDLTRFDASRSNEAEIPAPGLDPEEFFTFEVGCKVRNERLIASASYYYTIIEDLIVRFPTGAVNADGDDIVTKDNVGDGYANGVEMDVRVLLPHDVTAYGGFAWVEGKVDTFPQPGVKSEEPLDRLAPLTALLGVRYEPAGQKWRVEGDVKVAGDADRLSPRDEADTQRIPPIGTPGYAVFGVRGSYEPYRGLQLFAALENLTDEDFRVHGSGSNEPGINLIAGLDWRF